MELTPETIPFILSIATMVGVIFTVYLHFRKPQIQTDKEALKLREEFDALKDVVDEVKEKHLRSVEKDLKGLTGTIHELSLTMTRLSTIIDERIPKTM